MTRRADKLLDHAPATLLLSAQTAQLEGDEGAARTFQEMLKHQETEFLGLRGLLAQAMKDGDWESALTLARRAYLRRPNTPWVLTRCSTCRHVPGCGPRRSARSAIWPDTS